MGRKNLRQKTYGVFIKPYFEYAGDRIVHRGNILTRHPCQSTNSSTVVYATLLGGDAYMLNYTSTSFPKIRIRVKELMDEIGLSIDDILVTEITPVNLMVTPLS